MEFGSGVVLWNLGGLRFVGLWRCGIVVGLLGGVASVDIGSVELASVELAGVELPRAQARGPSSGDVRETASMTPEPHSHS